MVCTTDAGQLDPQFIVYLVIGTVLTFAWSFGVPAYFARQLYRHRATIESGNTSYAGIAPLRPLYMFATGLVLAHSEWVWGPGDSVAESLVITSELLAFPRGWKELSCVSDVFAPPYSLHTVY